MLAITFNPDEAVAAFPPPEVRVVLTKGLTQKEMRRGGMGNRSQSHEVNSIQGTEGEYMD